MKRVLSVFLTVALLMGTAALAVPAGAGDTSGLPAEELQIFRWAADKGLIDPDAYDPDDTFTTAEYVVTVWKLLGCPESRSRSMYFKDVPASRPDYEALLWAANAGMLTLPNSRILGPDGSVTRIAALYDLYLLEGWPAAGGTVHYTDTYFTAYYIKALDWAFVNGLTDKEAGGEFLPHELCTWQEMLGFLFRWAGENGPVAPEPSAEERQIAGWAAGLGLIDPASYFPEEAITNAEYVVTVWKLLGCPASKSRSMYFNDVPASRPDYEAILWAANAGMLILPYSGLFEPDKYVTRACVLHNLYMLEGLPTAAAVSHFADTPVTAYYVQSLDWAFENGLTDVTAGGNFLPSSICSREEMLGFLFRWAGGELAPEPGEPASTLADFKWVAFGDSLTDITGTLGQAAPNKYHQLIAAQTGMDVVFSGLGGTGYWRGGQNCYWQRMARADYDPEVDVVTIFGSVNDHTIFEGINQRYQENYEIYLGLGADGETLCGWEKMYLQGDRYDPFSELSLTETVSGGYDTWVALVNETINQAHAKYPNAKIVLVNELRYYNTKTDQLERERRIREAIVAKRVAAGDTWLSIVKLNESTYEGKDVPERLYLDTVEGMGLSFEQLTNETFRSYYTYDSLGHPNDLYHRIWLAPMFAEILCDTLGVDPETLPESLRK